jgi:hypothetical protein
MILTDFISDLINKGEVTVASSIAPFTAEDIRMATVHLQQYYEDDCHEMPGIPPDFDEGAALWAAGYLYRVTQFILLRNLDETVIREQLSPYSGLHTPTVIYSADLTLRYLPDLFRLAKGIAPDDLLVKQMQDTAGQWPFSVAALATVIPEDLSVVLQHPSLQRAYTDRIIQARDLQKCTHPDCLPLVREALGRYATTLWPQFSIDLNDHT